MNEYKYDDIKVGQEESFKTVITQEMMDSFKSITGDTNALHNDMAFAMMGGV